MKDDRHIDNSVISHLRLKCFTQSMTLKQNAIFFYHFFYWHGNSILMKTYVLALQRLNLLSLFWKDNKTELAQTHGSGLEIDVKRKMILVIFGLIIARLPQRCYFKNWFERNHSDGNSFISNSHRTYENESCLDFCLRDRQLQLPVKLKPHLSNLLSLQVTAVKEPL